jgi:valyl-tRNA synthetase
LVKLTWQQDNKPDLATKKTLLYVYQQVLLYLHPFIPFVTEYLYQKISGEKLLTNQFKNLHIN